MSTTINFAEIAMLTTKSLTRKFSMEHPEWLYLLPKIDKPNAALNVTVNYSDESSATMIISIGDMLSHRAERVNISESVRQYSQLNQLKTIENIVIAINSSDDQLTLYPYYPSDSSDNIIALYYRNSLSGYDSFITTGDFNKTLKTTHVVASRAVFQDYDITQDPEFRSINQKARRGRNIASGWNDREDLEALDDMFLVNDAFELREQNGQQLLLPIIFDQKSINQPSQDTTAKALEFSYKYAWKDMAINRVGGIPTKQEVLKIDNNTHIFIYFDSSGSMSSTEAPLETMRDTLLRDALIGFYDNDDALYDQRVTISSVSSERTLDMLNFLNQSAPTGNVVVMVFQDESTPYGVGGSTFNGSKTAQYLSDLSTFRNRLSNFAANYYRGVVFQVEGFDGFPLFLQSVQTGSGQYAGDQGLSDRTEIVYEYGLTDGAPATYYLDKVITAMQNLGFAI